MKLRYDRLACLVVPVLLLAACAGSTDKPGPAAAAATAAAVETEPNPFPGTRRRKGKNGETLYCWDYTPTGSWIPKTHCATAQVLNDRASDARRAWEAMREQAGMTGGCVPNTGSGC